MNSPTLVKMANQIGAFFESMSDRTEAIDGVALHIQRYWEPRMRSEFLRYVDAHAGDHELKDIVLEAVAKHRERLTPVESRPI